MALGNIRECLPVLYFGDDSSLLFFWAYQQFFGSRQHWVALPHGFGQDRRFRHRDGLADYIAAPTPTAFAAAALRHRQLRRLRLPDK